MKLSDMINSYLRAPRMYAKLKIEITLDDGTVFAPGTISEILIQTAEDTYHFEANNTACTVSASEIEIIE